MADFAWMVRAVHVLSAAFVVGGAILAAGAHSRSTAKAYEWAFWGAFALLLLTGIGNLGALGAGLPSPASGWGRRFWGKLSLVAAIALVAGWRVLLLSTGRSTRAAHVATALLASGALVMGVWLSHG